MTALNTRVDSPIKEILFSENKDLKSSLKPNKPTILEKLQDSRRRCNKRRLFPSAVPSAMPIENLFTQVEKPILLSSDPVIDSSHGELLANFVEKLEEIQKTGIEITDANIKACAAHIQKTTLVSFQKERKIEAADSKNESWKIISDMACGVSSVATMCLGVSLLTQGAILSTLAGVGLVFLGLASISGAIFEKAGVSTKVTSGVQLAGGVIGLIAGGGSCFLAGAVGNQSLAIRLGSGMISAAHYSAKAVETLYRKQSLEHRAESAKTEESLFINRDELQSTNNFIKFASEKYLKNIEAVILALKQEEASLQLMVDIQLQRRG